jgi:LPXTG-site transpeptidase (sortase) family protein
MISFNIRGDSVIKEGLIFLFLFIVVFSFSLFIFNGRFIYAQVKYHFLGPSPINSSIVLSGNQNSDELSCSENKSLQIPQRIIIPSLGIDAPIIWPENTNESALQLALEKGVAFWPESSLPEDKGTTIILGHSSAYPWYNGEYGSIFSLLNKINPGDEIWIFSPQKKYIYKVLEKEIQSPKDIKIEKQDGQSILYLLSCWPINTNWKRIAVKAISIDNI